MQACYKENPNLNYLIYIYFCVGIRVDRGEHVPGGQKITFGSQFCSSQGLNSGCQSDLVASTLPC